MRVAASVDVALVALAVMVLDACAVEGSGDDGLGRGANEGLIEERSCIMYSCYTPSSSLMNC